MRPFMLGLLTLVVLPAVAQTPDTVRLVMPRGNGSILVSTVGGYELKQLALYDQGTRADLFVEDKANGLNISYLLRPIDSYTDTTEKCRNAVLGGILEGSLAKATVKDKKNDSRALPNGQTIAIGSYVIAKTLGVSLDQTNIFGFFVGGSTCAEIHISKMHASAADTALFNAALDSFTYDPAYTPRASDYTAIATVAAGRFGDASVAKIYNLRAADLGGAAVSSPSAANPRMGLNFALASHSGYLHLDDPNYAVTEASAKPNGMEFGLRAKNKVDGTQILGFLYLPAGAPSTAVDCREQQLKAEEQQGSYRKITGRRELTSSSGVPIAVVSYEQSKKPAPYGSVIRAFVANNGLCADIEFTGLAGIPPGTVDLLLATLSFDPNKPPDFFAKFAYATVLYDHQAYGPAAPIFEGAIPLASTTDDPITWSRVATDQASIAYGISGNLEKSRAVNEAAIARDPLYPLYYYNLADADAEAGNAAAARAHLEQAYARRANTVKGETMPDASKDDSILKLKSNKEFWAFVESIPKN